MNHTRRLKTAAEQRFQEWLAGEEGQAQQQRHEKKVQELRDQAQQLEAELEGGSGGLFPQMAIDRNNELARLVSRTCCCCRASFGH